MSRVGKHPVAVPDGVKVSIEGQRISAEGRQGALARVLMDEVRLSREDEGIVVRPRDDSLRAHMMWGTARTLVSNLVTGVATGFSRKLDITGVGYRAQLQGKQLVLQLGYSHEVRYDIPDGVKIECPDQTHIVVSGVDKQLVGQVAAEVRSFRPVEPYKGKGIKYDNETVVRKEGKKK
ncbi:MAG: 50S ribosomal protein L6 [Rhodospirillales bacterium]